MDKTASNENLKTKEN